MRMKLWRMGLAALMAFVMLWSGAAMAEEVTVWFMNDDHTWYTYQVEFEEEVFGKDPGEMQPQLARMSMAMAVSAFRDWEVPERKEHLGEDYLSQAGFTDIRSWDYEGDPTPETIGVLMGRKKVGDRTVVAMVPSGEYYRKEWVSNLHVGDDTGEPIIRHEGFWLASEKVYERLTDYTRDLKGEWVLWDAGFSRAGAVANITAAMAVQRGLLPAERVYVYTFAIPAHTVMSEEEAQDEMYRGFRTFISPWDLVPGLFPSRWEFRRYGRIVWLPDPEGGDLSEISERAEDWSQAHFGVEWYQNDAAIMIRELVDSSLGRLMPTPEDYVISIQEELREMMRERDQVSDLVPEMTEEDMAGIEAQEESGPVMKWIRRMSEKVFGMSVQDYFRMCVQQGHRPMSYIPVIMTME